MNAPNGAHPQPAPAPKPDIYALAQFIDATGRMITQRTQIHRMTGFPSMSSEFYGVHTMMLQMQNQAGQIVQQPHQFEFKIPDVYTIIEAFAHFDDHVKAGGDAEIARLKKQALGKIR